MRKPAALFTTALALAALAASGPAAQAAPFDFTYTGSLVTFTVPVTGTYQIVSFGAQGGGNPTWSSGLGAEIGGDFGLTAGEKLQIAVGGAGATVTYSASGVGVAALSSARHRW